MKKLSRWVANLFVGARRIPIPKRKFNIVVIVVSLAFMWAGIRMIQEIIRQADLRCYLSPMKEDDTSCSHLYFICLMFLATGFGLIRYRLWGLILYYLSAISVPVWAMDAYSKAVAWRQNSVTLVRGLPPATAKIPPLISDSLSIIFFYTGIILFTLLLTAYFTRRRGWFVPSI